MPKLSPSTIAYPTVAYALTKMEGWSTSRQVHQHLKAPEGYPISNISNRLNYLATKGFVEGENTGLSGPGAAKKKWRITDEGREYVKEAAQYVQTFGEYEPVYIGEANGKPEIIENSVAEQEQLFSPTANQAMDDIGELVGLSSEIENTLNEILNMIHQVDKEFDLDNALNKLGLDDKTLTKLSSLTLFKSIVDLARDVKFKVKVINKIKKDVEASLDEQS